MAASQESVKAQADLVKAYSDELEKAHKENEEVKDLIFEIDMAIASLLRARAKLKASLGKVE